MTITEAEEQYYLAKESHCIQHKNKAKKEKTICIRIAIFMITIGIILLLVAICLPLEIDSFGDKCLSVVAIICYFFGGAILILGFIPLMLGLAVINKVIKNGPVNFIGETKDLYMNYLRCEDMSESDKDFYKEKLQEIRNAELIKATNSVAASVIMAGLLHK